MTGASSSTSLSSFSHSSYFSSGDSSSCSSPSPSFPLDVALVVPFLWEEKPGVSKQIMLKSDVQVEESETLSPHKVDPLSFVSATGEDFRPLRPPPCLQKSSQVEASRCQKEKKLSVMYKNHVRSISQSFPSRRPHRKWKSDDDPFLLAMEVCTKQEKGSLDPVHARMKDVARLMRTENEQSRPQCSCDSSLGRKQQSTIKKSTRTSFTGSSIFGSELGSVSFTPTHGVVEGKEEAHAHENAVELIGERDERHRLPIFCGTERSIVDAEATQRYCEAPNHSGKASRAERSSRNKLQGSGVDTGDWLKSRQANGVTPKSKSYAMIQTKPSSSTTRKQQSQPVELSCGEHRKTKSVGNKQLLPDVFGCRSIHSFDSVIEPTRGGRFFSHRS